MKLRYGKKAGTFLFVAFLLAGCGGKTETTTETATNNVETTVDTAEDTATGSWALVSMTYNGTTVGKEDLEDMGTSLTLELLEDGTGTMDYDGTVYDLTWDDSTITTDGVADSYTLEDGVLVLANDDTEMVFERPGNTAAVTAPVEEAGQVVASDSQTETAVEDIWTVVPLASAQELVPYSCTEFSMNIPEGWTVEAAPAAAGMFHAIRVYDPACPVNQILFQIKMQPLFPSEDARALMAVNFPDMQHCPVLYDVSTEGFFSIFSDYAASFEFEPAMGSFRMPGIQDFAVQESFAGNGQMSSVAVSSNVVRATFTQNGAEGEGMFSVELVPFAIESGFGYYMAYNIVAITAEKDSFQDWEDMLSRSLGSIAYSQEFVSYAMSQSDQTVATSQLLSQAASEMSDSIMSSWENRNKSQDIMSQKQSDAMLGYERIVDTETGNIYKIDNGFTDWYDGPRYKAITDDQYTDSVEAVIHWK